MNSTLSRGKLIRSPVKVFGIESDREIFLTLDGCYPFVMVLVNKGIDAVVPVDQPVDPHIFCDGDQPVNVPSPIRYLEPDNVLNHENDGEQHIVMRWRPELSKLIEPEKRGFSDFIQETILFKALHENEK